MDEIIYEKNEVNPEEEFFTKENVIPVKNLQSEVLEELKKIRKLLEENSELEAEEE
ncbi:unnamed protein product [marine sediment metagenome]|uniref:Uncharacterized protein n=1 Tax=marine sediment metagenome TaxID=412755 RepID=X1AXQ0_9ZZZZ